MRSMNRLILAAALIIILAGSTQANATESASQQVNSWSQGQPIAVELLSYRKLAHGAAYTPAPEDSTSIIGTITNAHLLVAMLFDSRIDPRVFALTVERALRLSGPQSFFGEVARRYQEKPEWLLFPLHKRLYTEMKERHAVVEAVFISESDMPVAQAMSTMRRIITDLQSAKSWEDAFDQYSRTLRTEMDLGSAGAPSVVSISKLAKFGPVILCERTRADETFVSDLLPSEHRSALLKGAAGEVLLTHDAPHSRIVLYRVREAYVPRPE
jgi:hypothetical protein